MKVWTRKGGDIVKSAHLSEGQIVSLLLAANGKADSDVIFDAYESLKSIAEQRAKAFSLLVTATVLAIAAKYDVISGFSAAGMTVAQAAFKPIALASYSVAGLYYAYFESRFRFFELWFESIFQKSSPSYRAELLLRFPLAFDIFKLDPASRGYPANVWPKRSDLWRLLSIFLLLSVLMIFLVLGFALWVSLAVDVWTGAFPNRFVSGAVVVGSLLASVLSGCLPLTGPKKRLYRHYGLSHLMTVFHARSPMRYAHWTPRIGKVSAEMNEVSNGK